MYLSKGLGVILCVMFTIAGANFAWAADKKSEKVTDPVLAGFIENAKAYVELRTKIEKDLPPLKDKEGAEEINAHQRTVRMKIAAARSGARRGSLFTPEVTASLKRILDGDLRGPDGKMARTTMTEESPAHVACKVNAAYPSNEPVSTVPPDLLQKLPQLPDNLEYRFSKRGDLILRDAKANMIVDCLPGAVSTVKKSPETKTE
ncbi:MAG: hypothetical protein EHM61_21870 [Acidobacteria bacterium]|nr:MAG: hypothetical protein EHM61_21870 [Acidobacteriota bacterium]